MSKHPEGYYEFFRQFNAGEYYACHDLLEDIWMEQRTNKFLQGLLQMSVAIFHFHNGNIKGARTLFTSSRRYLEPYRPCYWDLELEPVVRFIDDALASLPPEKRVPIAQLDRYPFPPVPRLEADQRANQ